MNSFELQLGAGLTEMRTAAEKHRHTEVKLADLEQHDLAKRIASLEGNWRLAIWLAAAMALLLLGLVGDAIRAALTG